LVKDVQQPDTCDWHVDDQGFWPESFISTASEQSGKDQSGINAWIALDDMPQEYEGSMAVCPGSHQAEWRWEAYEAIGQDRTKSGLSFEEMMQSLQRSKKGFATCDGIRNERPDIREKLEANSVIMDFRRGDVVLATRLLFHRTMPVTPEGQEYFQQRGIEVLMRYSVRYVPGSACLPNGYSTEWSILDNPKNKAQSINDVVSSTGDCWYPQVWPVVEEDLDSKLDLIGSKIPEIKEKEKSAFATIRSAMMS